MKRFLAAAFALVLFMSLQPIRDGGSSAAAQRLELTGLASIYALAGGAVRDTNGDGLADSVAARPPPTSPGDSVSRPPPCRCRLSGARRT